MATFVWKAGTNGDWSTATDWAPATGPGPLDIAAFVGGGTYVVTVASAETIAGIKLNAAGATLQVNNTLTVDGTLAVTAGTLDVASYATLANATISVGAGSSFVFGSFANLSGDTYRGTLEIGDASQTLNIENGLTVTGANGTGDGTIVIDGTNASLSFVGGAQTLDKATVDIGGDNAYANLALASTGSSTQLTLGSKLLIEQTGAYAELIAADSFGTIVNKGSIDASVEGGTFTIFGAGTFENQGTISVANGDTLQVQGVTFSNTGKIIENGAVLNIGGTVTSAGLGSISRTGGTLIVSGTLDNSGHKLVLGDASSLGTLELSGTIINGVIVDPGTGLQFDAGATLSGVTYDGTLSLDDYDQATIENGILLTSANGTGRGSLDLTGLSDSLSFSGPVAQTLDNAGITLGSASQDTIQIFGTTTFGAHLTMTHGSGYAAVFDASVLTNLGTITAGVALGVFTIYSQNSGTFDNAGQISISGGDTVSLITQDVINTGTIAVTTGGTLNLGAVNGTLSNTGKVMLNGGQINVGGAAITQSQLAAIKRTSGTLGIAGTLLLGGGTLSIGKGSAFGTMVLSGTISGGTIHDAGGGLLFGGLYYSPTILDDVTYKGTLDLSAAASFVQAQGDFSLSTLTGSGSGLIKLTGSGSALTLLGSETLDNLTIVIGATALPGTTTVTATTLNVTPINTATPVTLTLGVHAHVVQTGSLAQISNSYYFGDAILNRGTIVAGISGGAFAVNNGTLLNRGVIAISNGDLFTVTGSLVNSGVITVATDGTLALGGAWSNTGTISENAGTVLLGNTVTVAQLGQIKRTGGSIVIGGPLALGGATVSVGTGSKLGNFAVTGLVSGGTVHDAGGGMMFGSNGLGASVSALTYQGTLTVGAVQSGTTAFGGVLIDAGGLTVTGLSGHGAGAIVLNGGSLSAALMFRSTQTLDNATITLAGSNALIGLADYGVASVLTLGSKVTVTQTAASATLNSNGYSSYQYYTGDAMVNDGTINASARHGYMYIFGPSFTNHGVINVSNGEALYLEASAFTNTGTLMATNGGVLQLGFDPYTNTGKISETNATLLLAGPVTLKQLGSIAHTGGVLEIEGSLDLADATLNVGTGTAMGSLSVTGVIANGKVHDAGNGIQFFGQYLGGGGTLDNVTYQGVLDLKTSYTSLTVVDGLALTGASGAGAGVIALTGAGSKLVFDNSQTFDNATITIGNTALASALNFQDTSLDGETLTLGAHLVLNAKSGMSLITSTRALGDTILNRGSVAAQVTGATVSLFGGTFENAGLVSVGNGATAFIEPDLLENVAGATMRVGSGGHLVIGAAAGSGLFQIQAGGILDVTDDASVTATFAASTGVLQLDAPGSYHGSIAGITVGDVIDFSSATATGPSVKSGKLLVTVAGTAVSIGITGALTGNHFVVSSDGAGGTDLILVKGAASAHAALAGVPPGSTSAMLDPPRPDLLAAIGHI